MPLSSQGEAHLAHPLTRVLSSFFLFPSLFFFFIINESRDDISSGAKLAAKQGNLLGNPHLATRDEQPPVTRRYTTAIGFCLCNNAKSREYFSSYLTRDRIGRDEKLRLVVCNTRACVCVCARINPSASNRTSWTGRGLKSRPTRWKVNCAWNEPARDLAAALPRTNSKELVGDENIFISAILFAWMKQRRDQGSFVMRWPFYQLSYLGRFGERGGCGPRGNIARGMELGLNRRGGGRYVFIACNYVDFFVDTAVWILREMKIWADIYC